MADVFTENATKIMGCYRRFAEGEMSLRDYRSEMDSLIEVQDTLVEMLVDERRRVDELRQRGDFDYKAYIAEGGSRGAVMRRIQKMR